MRRAVRLRVETLRWLRGLWRLLLVLGTLSRVLVEIRQTRPDLLRGGCWRNVRQMS